MDRAGDTLSPPVAIITGGARGIGLAAARAFIARGHHVGLIDVDEEALAAAVRDSGAHSSAVADVSQPPSLRAAIDALESELGPVDVLVNNAGIMPIGPTVEESDATTARLLGINVVGVVVGTKRALETMIPRERGHIVNIASMASDSAIPGGATYCGSKAAVSRFTDAVRLEVRRTGVRCSTVHPSFTRTELIAGTKPSRAIRMVDAEDVARAVVHVLDHPRAHVYVPRVNGLLLRLQAVLPQRVSESMGRAFGAEKVFLDVDADARADYERRARGRLTTTKSSTTPAMNARESGSPDNSPR